eukprot:1199482-Alexandrium_andersonii.AAC.1
MDYCFLSRDADSESFAVLVFKDRDSRAILAHPVLCKGRLRSDTIEQAADRIRRLGHRGRFLLKTDNEPALVDVEQGVADALAHASGVGGLRVVLESPAASGPQANGSAKQLKGL